MNEINVHDLLYRLCYFRWFSFYSLAAVRFVCLASSSLFHFYFLIFMLSAFSRLSEISTSTSLFWIRSVEQCSSRNIQIEKKRDFHLSVFVLFISSSFALIFLLRYVFVDFFFMIIMICGTVWRDWYCVWRDFHALHSVFMLLLLACLADLLASQHDSINKFMRKYWHNFQIQPWRVCFPMYNTFDSYFFLYFISLSIINSNACSQFSD